MMQNSPVPVAPEVIYEGIAVPDTCGSTLIPALCRLLTGSPPPNVSIGIVLFPSGPAFEKPSASLLSDLEKVPLGVSGGVSTKATVAVGELQAEETVLKLKATSGKAPRKGFQDFPDKPIFKVKKGENEDNSRAYDAERKLLEAYHIEITTQGIGKGTLDILVNRVPCPSCENVFTQFQQMHPEIQLRVYYPMKVLMG
jgi:The  BURPS668_1122 family of deaminases